VKRIALILMLICLPPVARADDAPLKLSLREAIKMAAEKNLDVRAEFYNPAQFEAEIHRNSAIYDPLLSLDTSYADTTSPTTSINGESFNADASLSQLLWTGASVSAIFQNSYSKTNSLLGPGTQTWQSQLGVTLSQPLLKNAGRETTEVAISISRLSKFASIEHLKTRMINTVAQVRTE